MLGTAVAPRLTADQSKSAVFVLFMLLLVASTIVVPIAVVSTAVLMIWHPFATAALYGLATGVGVLAVWTISSLLAPEPPRL